MNKVVYTCINGKYDTLKEPKVITKGWDYICFCDDYPDHEEDTIWKIITIGKTDDIIRYQRKKKIYNEWIFDSYDLSVWVDGSMIINCNLDKFIEPFLESKKEFGIMKHPAQTCITGEARGILILKKDKKEILEKQISDYFNEGYPKDFGIVASGIIIRKHTKKVRSLCKIWYEQVEKYSLRDQMSFGYAFWKSPVSIFLMSFDIIYREFLIQKHKKTIQF